MQINSFTLGLALVLVLVLGAFTGLTPAQAQPPETVLLQGQLLDGNGEPIVGLRQYRVRFHDAATDGSQLGPDIVDVTLINTDGLFAIPVLMPQAALEAPATWYELAIDSDPIPDGVGAGDVFPQRVRVHSVPFARVAGEALQVATEAIGDGSVNLDEFNRLAGVTGNVQTQLNAKADASMVYTQAEVDSQQSDQDALIAQKADAADLFQWQVITGGPVQMQANRGYVVDSVSPVSLTLPTSAALEVGDVVRISGIGAGGWQLGQQTDQQILSQSLLVPDFSTDWTPREASRQWRSVASSADGMTLAGAAADNTLHISRDAGATWISRGGLRQWRAIASSADGTRLVAAEFGGQLYTSDDSGENWTARESDRDWTDVASSADGMKLVAVVVSGQIYTSDNGGVSWTPRESNRDWLGVASSADGVKLVATEYGGLIYTSDDSGATWTPNAIAQNWWKVASSADGSRLIVMVDFGQLYTSTDSGVTWTPRESPRTWRDVASSASGNRLAAVAINGRIYTSEDGGVSWTARESQRAWIAVASSADGERLIAGVNNDRLYTSPRSLAAFGKPSTEGVAGGLIGSQHSAVELQYIGNDQFMPLSFAGDMSVR